MRKRLVMGIETSCDETAVAIVTEDKKILSNLILSQEEHIAFGGVVPEIAARAHLNHIDEMIKKSLNDNNLKFTDLDAIAVTAGPGLIGGILVGAITAKSISTVHKIPLVAVNHLEGHALTVRLTDDVKFPYLLLLVSGGHCQLLIVENIGEYKRLGGTLDDALGEAFDKTSKLLGLDYPGGPIVEKMAAECIDKKSAVEKFPLPTPLLGRKNCDFSFSGIKTAVKRYIDKLPNEIERNIATDICYSFQYSVSKVIKDRTERAIKEFMKFYPEEHNPALVIAGGVAANKVLRDVLEESAKKYNMNFAAPPLTLCTDNAVMIAWAGMEKFLNGEESNIDFPVFPRWPLESLNKNNKNN